MRERDAIRVNAACSSTWCASILLNWVLGAAGSCCEDCRDPTCLTDAESEQQFLLEMDGSELRLQREKSLLSEAQKFLSAQAALKVRLRCKF